MLVETYEALAPRYDRLHGRWLRHAGGEAQAAFEGAAAGLIRPGMRVADIGCGTGQFARRLLASSDYGIDLTLVDPSAAMLARTSDLPVRRIRAVMEDMPLKTGAYDLVTCAWALETSGDLAAALGELLRVTRKGGALLAVFCADRHGVGPVAGLMRRALLRRGTGWFLDRGRVRDLLATSGATRIRYVSCGGPAAVVLCEKG